ncbi:MAG: protein kinase [Acidobacteriia bacterium]|nr:protein kinase [Terriglobia bacterium]
MIGRVIEGFQVTEKLGEGGMGVVYRAVDTTLGRVVALKALHSELTKDPQLTERFLSEARTQAQLNHPNLATLYRLFQFENNYFMVMEFVEGETVAQKIRKDGPIPQEQAVVLFKQALAGLAHAHHVGIIHRDIKPSNLMVNRQNIVKVMDFGIAKVLGGRGLTATGVRLGTLYYMAPEQIKNQPLDIRTDIYSLGITLYEMLTARVPFDSNSDYDLMQLHIQQIPPPPRGFFPYLNQGIEAAILQALEKDPGKRFQTVEAFSNALDVSMQFQPTVSYQTPPLGVVNPASGSSTGSGPTAITPGMTPASGMAPTVATPLPLQATPPSGAAIPINTPISGFQTPTPIPTGQPPPDWAPSPAVKKSSLGPVAWVVSAIVLLAFLGIFLVYRQVAKARQALNVMASQTPVEQPTPGLPAPASQTSQGTAAPELTTASVTEQNEKKGTKDSKKGQDTSVKNARKGSRAPVEAATQAMVQQQIELERQRLAQQAARQQGKIPAAPVTSPPSVPSAAAETTYRWRVQHNHGGMSAGADCIGTLVASKSRVSYFPEKGSDTFDVPAGQVKEVKKNGGFWSGQSFHIKLANGENFNFVRLGPNNRPVSPMEIVIQMRALLKSATP